MRWLGSVLVIGLVIALATACGDGSASTPTLPPGERTATAEVRAATATAAAEDALAGRPPCIFDPATLEAMQVIADTLWAAGTQIGQADPSRALRFYEASIGYGLLNECRDVGAVPTGTGTPITILLATPIVDCPPDADRAITDLQNAWAKGMPIAMELLLLGVDPEVIEILTSANAVIMQRIDELEAACGLRPPATPAPLATPLDPNSG